MSYDVKNQVYLTEHSGPVIVATEREYDQLQHLVNPFVLFATGGILKTAICDNNLTLNWTVGWRAVALPICGICIERVENMPA